MNPEMFAYFGKAFPAFALYFAVSVGLTIAFLTAYSIATPQKEFALIRSGNSSAAFSLLGALLGFVIPLSTVIQHSVSIADLVLWGIVVLVVQILAFFATRLFFKQLDVKITENCPAHGAIAGGIALAVGLLNAGCMVP